MSTEYKNIFLTDGVVVLRPVCKADIPFCTACINDPSVRRNIRHFMPVSEEDEVAWYEGLSKKKPNDVTFAIEVEDKIIGIMGLHRIDWKDRVGTTGAMIKEVANRGKGYGTRAKMLLLYWAFYECNMRKICSSAYAFNTASIRFNEKCGYKPEGLFRKHVFCNGEFVDMIPSAVFLEDFKPLWEAHKEKCGIVL